MNKFLKLLSYDVIRDFVRGSRSTTTHKPLVIWAPYDQSTFVGWQVVRLLWWVIAIILIPFFVLLSWWIGQTREDL